MRWDRILLSGYHFASNLFRRGLDTTPRIAGVLSTKNYTDAASAFPSLKALSDVTIVLDDNSESAFRHRHECDEYLTLRNGVPWNDVANRTLLLYRAFVHGCDWVVCMDDDVMFSHGFQTKQDVLALIAEMQSRKQEICYFPLRDLWESDERYRCDGTWGRKTFIVLRKNWFFYRSISLSDTKRRLHAPLFPINLRPRRMRCEQHVAYHLGCITQEARERRVEKYRQEDPENAFQADYSYMLSTDGLQLAPVPPEDRAIIARKLGR